MKKNIKIVSVIIALVGLAFAISYTSYAKKDKSEKEKTVGKSRSTYVHDLTVYLGPGNCPAQMNCEIEILILDVNSCSVDTRPIARQDYVYGQPTVFTDLTIQNGYMRICAKLKSGTECDETFYPKCDCQVPDTSMTSYIDVCNP